MTLTIEQGESVAFVNTQGFHNVNGVTNTLTGESFNNPADFSLGSISGNADGVCMGTVTFDVPGSYNYDCSIGVHAELGMVGSITVNPAPVTTTIWDIVEGSDDHTYLERHWEGYLDWHFDGRTLNVTEHSQYMYWGGSEFRDNGRTPPIKKNPNVLLPFAQTDWPPFYRDISSLP